MSYIIYNGKMITSGGKYVSSIVSLPIVQLFSFNTTGTNLSEMKVYGGSFVPEDNASWDLGDTSSNVPVISNQTINHTYSGAYVSPADKTAIFSMMNPNHASNLSIGNTGSLNNGLYDIDLSNFESLDYLYLYKNNLTSLDLSNNPNLLTVNCGFTKLTSLDLTNNPNIMNAQISDSSISSLVLGAVSYPSLGNLYFYNNNMSSIDVSNFVDYIWTNRTKLTSGYKMMNLAGNNAFLNFSSVHKIVRMETSNNFGEFGSDYNVPNNIMKNYFSTNLSYSDIVSYFMAQLQNGPTKSSIYGNTITAADGSLSFSFKYYMDTSIADFQSSSIVWNVVTRYKKDSASPTWTTLDNTNYTFTSNTVGMQLQRDISLNTTGILGNKNFVYDFQITLTDNRADKTQDPGDYMMMQFNVEMQDNPFNNAIVIGGESYYKTIDHYFNRAKWGA